MDKRFVLPAVCIISLLILSSVALAVDISSEEQARRQTQEIVRRNTMGSPAPDPDTGYRVVTHVPKDIKYAKKKTYLLVSYPSVISESKLEDLMQSQGFKKISYRESRWAFSKWKYANA